MYRIALLGIFLVVMSPALIFFLEPIITQQFEVSVTPELLSNDHDEQVVIVPDDSSSWVSDLILVYSLASPLFSVAAPVLGFAATAMAVIFGWRKDRREAKRAALENQELLLKIRQLEEALPARKT